MCPYPHDPPASRVSVSRSRARFTASLSAQKPTLARGLLAWIGHPCQKQPSTKTATLALVKGCRPYDACRPSLGCRLGSAARDDRAHAAPPAQVRCLGAWSPACGAALQATKPPNPGALWPAQVRLSRCARTRCHSRGPCGGSSGRSTRRPPAAVPADARPLESASRR